ncbi:DUF421 domain-containing protein [Paenibacillus xerothermodurans]|uniref:DUF421 domain-containing protein n=2 Tax=Paenibacillus xerothermodurans TaxID=1977292 RepID=A0A2W1N9R0_PAEXE|nr:DUF421 domain-containing protein [Paenibacillus xerothermodurans]
MVGVPSVVIKDGKMKLNEIKRAKLTTDEVEVALRRVKVSDLKDVDVGIFESSGRFSTLLKPEQRSATKKDIQTILDVLAANGFRITEKKVTEVQPAGLFKEAYKEAKDADYKPNKP